ncbi:MAG: signal peptidase I [Bacteroidales bacterium]|jgi:signal peptidase I
MKQMNKKYITFAILSVLYVLLIVWLKCFWWLLGLIVIFDIYITKKVNWTFWKKRNGPNSSLIEWLDALIFAVIIVSIINIVLFQNYRIPTPSMEKSLLVGDHLAVSKLAYGPRLPNTPLAMPFMQNTIPGTTMKSWSNLIIKPYKRAAGFGTVKNNQPFVFNFPEGDTVVMEEQATSYYEIVRRTAREMKESDPTDFKPLTYYMPLARNYVLNNSNIVYRPVDRRDNYVKRCIGIPGDIVEIKGGDVYINNTYMDENPQQQTTYVVITNGTQINPKTFERLNIAKSDINRRSSAVYELPLTKENAEELSKLPNVVDVRKVVVNQGKYSPYIFPHNDYYNWNEDNLGPIWIPKKGETVEIDTINICLYRRIIDVYEENDLKIENSVIYINGEPSTHYTFKMDYYWAMGDNRHNSADSRYWGFVPEDHVVGRPKFVWLSLDMEASGLKKIRFNRFFRAIR